MKKKVAFICDHNSCRSQMAEAIGNHLYGDRLECYSAGTELKAQINQDAVRLMKDIYGIDDNVYRMCKDIRNFMKDKKYSDIIAIVAITPVIAPEDLDVDSKWRNSINYQIKYRVIDIRKSIDFDEYVNSDIDNKCRLIIKNILKQAIPATVSHKGCQMQLFKVQN